MGKCELPTRFLPKGPKVIIWTYPILAFKAERKKQIAALYNTLPKENQYALPFWGVADADSWIRSLFKRKDCPLLYDDSYQPKPACQGFMEGLKENRTVPIE